MEKIKSRWRKNYLEGAVINNDTNNNTNSNTNGNSNGNSNGNGESIKAEDIETNGTDNNNKHNHHHGHHNHHHHHHHHHHHSSSKHSAPPQYDHLDENLYLDKRKSDHSRSRKDARSMVCDCILTKEERARGIPGCLDDCLNRMLMIECGPKCTLGDHCLNKRFQKCQSAKVEVFKTKKKGWGLRATTDLPAGSFIMEYVGEVIRFKEFRSRVKKYNKQKIKHHYFMALRSDEIIDSTCRGNLTRFINHSCEPNCETQKWTVNGDLRIGFFALRDLKSGEEITFDYQFQRYGRKAQKCYCGTKSCRGYIGGNEQTLSLNGHTSPSVNETQPGFKIPRLNRLQRMEIEKKMEEEVIDADLSNKDKSSNEFNNPFARSFFKTSTTNGLVNSTASKIPTTTTLPVKRKFNSVTTNNIDLTPAPKLSKEEHRQQFEMCVRLKDYYDNLEKQFGPVIVEQVKLATRAFPSFNGLPLPLPLPLSIPLPVSLPVPPPIPVSLPVPAPIPVSLPVPTPLPVTLHPPLPQPQPQLQPQKQAPESSNLIVLANHSIESSNTIDDDLAFSICDYDEYYSNRDKTPGVEDILNGKNPYPGSYYTTPDGDVWYVSSTLDRRTQRPRTVILNLQSKSSSEYSAISAPGGVTSAKIARLNEWTHI